MSMRLLIAALAALFFAACATEPKSVPTDVIVLLPHADGTTGAVVATQGNRKAVLDSPYASARSGGDGVPKTGKESEESVKKEFAGALAALPPAPVSFVVYFKSGGDEFTDESKILVARLLEEMGRRPSPEITVVGHTDRVGSDQANDALSLQRAGRVRELLIQRGVAADRIIAAGRGERDLLVPTADGIDEPRNRRVEISVR